MTAMEWGRDNSERLRELAAQIAIEQDHDKFTALVKKLHELLDGNESPEESERPPKDPDVHLPSL